MFFTVLVMSTSSPVEYTGLSVTSRSEMSDCEQSLGDAAGTGDGGRCTGRGTGETNGSGEAICNGGNETAGLGETAMAAVGRALLCLL
jgi:hypothetical protein